MYNKICLSKNWSSGSHLDLVLDLEQAGKL